MDVVVELLEVDAGSSEKGADLAGDRGGRTVRGDGGALAHLDLGQGGEGTSTVMSVDPYPR